MILQANDLFDAAGNIKQQHQACLKGFQSVKKPLQGLHITKQQLDVLSPLTIQEQVAAGVYFTFNTLFELGETDSMQVMPVYQSAEVEWHVNEASEYSWTQIYIDWSQLAAITGEDIELVKVFFKRQISHETGANLSLLSTRALIHEFNQLANHAGKHLSTTGKLYSLILQCIENIQIHRHITQCEDCHKKLYAVQNRIEVNTSTPPRINELAAQSGLTPTALEIGFQIITGMSVSEYQIECAFRKALASTDRNETLAHKLTAEMGWTQQDIEKACLKRFGVMTHQLGSMQ